MNEPSGSWISALTRTRTVPLIARLEAYMAQLSGGDRLIAYSLLALTALISIASVYVLERQFLVPTPAYGGTITEGVVGSPRFVNPLLALSDADRDLTQLMYAGLMGIDASGSLVPVLAERYEISEDGKTYTFTLRENAQFSDGNTVTAEDVVFTVEKAQNPNLKSPEFANWSGVTVSAPDARTVQFVLRKPYAPFLENMTLGILPARLWNDISDEQFPFSPLAIEPVGAGPFAFESLARDKGGLVTEYTLKANRHYVLGRPYLDEIHFVFFSQEDELLAALKAGDVESAYGIPSEEALTAPYARVFGVFWNPNTNQIFARTEVRKALSFALDRDRLVQDVLGGYATAIMGPVPPGSKVTEAPVLHFEDPIHAAAEELRGAGWTYDTTERAWKNEDAKLSFNTLALKTSNVPELKSVAGAIKEDWEKLGITVDIELYEPGDLNQNVIRPRKYDALLFGMVIGREVDLYAFWSSAERNDPGLNIALYANKTVDTLLEEARQTSDEQKRLVNLQKVEEIIAAEYPAAFTHAPDFVYVTRKDLKGVRLPQITLPSDRFASVSEWYLDIDYVWPFLLSNT